MPQTEYWTRTNKKRSTFAFFFLLTVDIDIDIAFQSSGRHQYSPWFISTYYIFECKEHINQIICLYVVCSGFSAILAIIDNNRSSHMRIFFIGNFKPIMQFSCWLVLLLLLAGFFLSSLSDPKRILKYGGDDLRMHVYEHTNIINGCSTCMFCLVFSCLP